MNLIGYRDYCVISRTVGKDEWDNPIRSTIYEGACLYEEGGVTYASQLVTRRPTFYIPEWTSELIYINDFVEITTETGRVISGVIRTVRDIHLASIVQRKLTRVELKQAKED